MPMAVMAELTHSNPIRTASIAGGALVSPAAR